MWPIFLIFITWQQITQSEKANNSSVQMSREQQNKASLGFVWVFQDYVVCTRLHVEDHLETWLITECAYWLITFKNRSTLSVPCTAFCLILLCKALMRGIIYFHCHLSSLFLLTHPGLACSYESWKLHRRVLRWHWGSLVAPSRITLSSFKIHPLGSDTKKILRQRGNQVGNR